MPSTSGSTAVAPASRRATPATVRVHPLTTRSSTSSTGPGGHVGHQVVATLDRGDALRRVGRTLAGVDRRVDDGEACRRSGSASPATVRSRGRRRAGAASTTRCRRSRPAARPSRPTSPSSPSATRRPATAGPGRPRRPTRNSARSACPCPRSVSRAIARPAAGPVPILPLRSSPRLASAVGQSLRGSIATPGRESASPASATAASETVAGQRETAAVVAASAVDRLGVVELGCAGTASGTRSSRDRSASRPARAGGPPRPGRSAPRRRTTARRSRPSRPGRGGRRRRRRAP